MSGQFTKQVPAVPPRQAEWEVRGLQWLAQAEQVGGARVVRVLDWSPQQVIEPRLRTAPATAGAALDFGRRLAATHLAGAPGFGVGPDGWLGDGFIGRAVMPMAQSAQQFPGWGGFYAELRLLPFARQARDGGSLDVGGLAAVERVCERLRDGEFDDGRPPSRIHGDLWSGNLVFTADGAVLIDPAAHGGHAETDLAMLDLFGCPQLAAIRQGWAEVYRPDADWPSRTGLHQLHPLLVHALLFGGGYGRQAAQVARQFA